MGNDRIKSLRLSNQEKEEEINELKEQLETAKKGLALVLLIFFFFEIFINVFSKFCKNQRIFKKQSVFSANPGDPMYFRLFFEYFFDFLGNLLITF